MTSMTSTYTGSVYVSLIHTYIHTYQGPIYVFPHMRHENGKTHA